MNYAVRTAAAALAALTITPPNSAQVVLDRATGSPIELLRHARSVRCTYTASAMTAFRPDRRITTEHELMITVYDDIDLKRGTARVIYEKGVPGGGAGDLTARWQGGALWLIETAPNGNLIMTTIFPRYAEGTTTDFLALDSRHSMFVIVSGEMSSGTCKVLT